MHPALLRRFIESVALMMQPITPHWSEIIYELLTAGQGGSVVTQSWPAYQPSDPMIRKQFVFFKNFLKTIRAESLKQKNVRQVLIFTASSYTAKRVVVLQYMQTQCDASGKFAQSFIKDLRAFIESTEELKGEMKEMMQFGSFMRDEAEDRGVDALAVTLSFDQIDILRENHAYLQKVLEVEDVVIQDVRDVTVTEHQRRAAQAVPGKPSFLFVSNKK